MRQRYQDASHSPQDRTLDLLSRMTLEEKIGQMCQVDGRHDPETWIQERHIGSFLHVTGGEPERLQKLASETRLGIPILFGIDAIHGHAFQNGATVFPTQLALASSWNPQLLEEVARVTAVEVLSTGLHWTFSPVLCIGRDTRWGRIGETFGEDPYLIGVLAAAMIRGYQGEKLSDPCSILACAKHFAAYGESLGGRDSAESEVSERKLRSIFLPPFKEAVRAGCATFMAGYNAIDGTPCSASRRLLTEILREEWGFSGFVVSDWNNVGHLHTTQKVASTLEEACEMALHAGNDMIMSTPEFYNTAIRLVKEGRIKEGVIDAACSRILQLKFRLGLFDDKRYPDKSRTADVLGCNAHREKAYEAALESMVLLKNHEGTLPFSDKIKRIALIGPNCDNVQSQLGDWSFGAREFELIAVPTLDYHPEYDVSPIITLREGIRRRACENVQVVYEKGCDLLDESSHSIGRAIKIADESDAIIAVVGDTNILNGETRDRTSLELTGAQQDLLCALKQTGKPLVVVLVCGKPLTVPWIAANADAVLLAWNSGMEGGRAVADLLFGDHNPCGKLAISFPRHIGQLPVYYNQLPGWHGGTYVEMDSEPLYAFGYGLSYTQFIYTDLQVSLTETGAGGVLTASVKIRNAGTREGMEIVQLYVHDVYSSVTTPVKVLKGFQRAALKSGQESTVTITVPVSALSLIDRQCREVLEPGEFEIMVGSSSRDEDLLRQLVTVS